MSAAHTSTKKTLLATLIVALMTIAPLGALIANPALAHADPGPTHDPALLGDDHGISDDTGFFNDVTGFTTKAGYRLVFAWDTDEPIAGIVHWGFSEDALDNVVRPFGNAFDSAQMAIMDVPRELADPSNIVHFRVQDQLSGTLSDIHSFPLGNAWTSDFSDGVYEINALMQIDTQALPDGLPSDQGLDGFADGIQALSERIWDASDGYVRLGHVIVTDTALNYPANVPFGVPIGIGGTPIGGGLCPTESQEVEGHIIQNTLADFLVETAPPADSHTYGEINGEPVIAHPCTAFYIGREGWLRIPFFFWEGDLDIAAVMHHEFGHYAYGMDDLYPINLSAGGCRVGVSGEPDNSAGRYDISVMHNSHGWTGTESNGRWEASEFDRANTPCDRLGGRVSWNVLGSHYPGIPADGRNGDGFPDHSDSAYDVARGNPDGDALNLYVLDHAVGVSSLKAIVKNEPQPAGTPQVLITSPTANDEVAPTTLDILGSVNRAAQTGNAAPRATLTADPDSGTAPLDVTFTPGASDDDGLVGSWSIDFGDGAGDSGTGGPPASVSHTYTADGVHEAVLTVTDDEGATGQAIATVIVGDAGGVHEIGTDPGGDVTTGTCSDVPGACDRAWVSAANDGFDLTAAYVTDMGDALRFTWQINDVNAFLDVNPSGDPASGPNHIEGYQLSIPFRTTPATGYVVTVERNVATGALTGSLGKVVGAAGVSFSLSQATGTTPEADRVNHLVHVDLPKDALPELAAVTQLTELDATTYFIQSGAGSRLLQTMDAGLATINDGGVYTLDGMVQLAGLGVSATNTPAAAPTAPPADPEIVDGNNDVFANGPFPGAPVATMDIEAGWFDNDDDHLYIGMKVADIPADATTTAQQAYHVNFVPDYPTNFPVGANTFTGLRVEAVLSAVAGDLSTLPPGVVPTDGVHKFTLQALSSDGTRSFFSVLAELPLSTIDADSDIVWWVVPRALIETPAHGDTFSALGADTGLAVQGVVTINIGDVAEGGLANYEWKGSDLPLSADAGGLYTGFTGQGITIAGTATGGVEPYTCSWSGTDAVFGDANGCTTTVTFTAPGGYFVDLTVTDGNGDTATDSAGVDISAPSGERVEVLLDGTTVLGSAATATSHNQPAADWVTQVSLSGLEGSHALTARWLDSDDSVLATHTIDVVVTGDGAAFVHIDAPSDNDRVSGTITIAGAAGHGQNPQTQGTSPWGPGGIFEMMPAVTVQGSILTFCGGCHDVDAAGESIQSGYETSLAWLEGTPGGMFDGSDGRWLNVAGFQGANFELASEFDTVMDVYWFNDPLDLTHVGGPTAGGAMPKEGVVPAGASWAFVYMRRPTAEDPDQAADTAILTLTPPLSEPRELSGEPSLNSVDLSWTAPQYDGGSAITAYEVLRDGVVAGTTAGDTTRLTDGGLSPDTTYTYRVRAVNGAGTGPLSNAIMVRTLIDITPPGSVSNLFATTTATEVSLSWDPATDAQSGVSHYIVRRGGAVVDANVAGTTFVDGGRTPGTTYTYSVAAVNGVGMEGNAASVQATTSGSTSLETVALSFGSQSLGSQVVDSVNGDGSFAVDFDTTTVTAGTYLIQAVYDDGQGGGDTDQVTVEVFNAAPFVRILNPLPGATVEPPITFEGSFSTTGDEPAPQLQPDVPGYVQNRLDDGEVQEVSDSEAFDDLRSQLSLLNGFLTVYPLGGGNGVHAVFTGPVPGGLPATIGDGWPVHTTGFVEPKTQRMPTLKEPTLTLTPEEIAGGALDRIDMPRFLTDDPGVQNGIGPGTALLITFGGSSFICTASFLTYDPVGDDYYLATAGHCVLNGGNGPVGPGPSAIKPDRIQVCVDLCLFNWVGLGIYSEVPDAKNAVVYARAGGVGKDFGLIKLPDALRSELRPEMFRWGGPMGSDRPTSGAFLAHFGHGVVTGSNVATQGRYSMADGDQTYSGGYAAIGQIWGGDSGSAVSTGHIGGPDIAHGDAASGTATHSSWIANPVVAHSLPFHFGTDWQWGLDDAKAIGGIDVLLVNEDGTLDGTVDPRGPSADFSFVDNGLDVSFTDISAAGDNPVTGWTWDFAGLGSSTSQNPSFSFPAAGSYQVALTVTDAAGATDNITRPVTVEELPETLTVRARLLGPDGVVVIPWTLVASPEQGENGFWQLPWNPADFESGAYRIQARMSDSGGVIDSASRQFLVGAIDGTPVLHPIGDRFVRVNETLAFAVTATDGDGDALTLSAAGLPAGATFTDNGDGTGDFSWMPNATALGTHALTFGADDGDFQDSETVDILVTNDQAPSITDLPDQSVPVRTAQSLTVSASDPDGDPITFSQSGLPPGGKIVDHGNGQARIDIPPQNQAGATYDVTIRASANGLFAEDTWTLTVVDWASISLDSDMGPFLDASPGETITIRGNVHNEGGSTLSVEFATSDQRGWTLTAPATVSLAPFQTRTVAFQVTVGDDRPDRVRLRAMIQGFAGAEDSVYWVVRTPAMVGLQLDDTSPLGLTGVVTTRYLDGAPARGVDVLVEDEYWLNPFGATTATDTGLTGLDGRFLFRLGVAGAPLGAAPGEHRLHIEAKLGSLTSTHDQTYRVGVV